MDAPKALEWYCGAAIPVVGMSWPDDVLVSLFFDIGPISSSLRCLVFDENASMSPSDLDLTRTMALTGELGLSPVVGEESTWAGSGSG